MPGLRSDRGALAPLIRRKILRRCCHVAFVVLESYIITSLLELP